jgi:hypothetical protein
LEVTGLTIREAIEFADDVKPNAFPDRVKVKWLEQLDGHIAAEEFRMNPEELALLRYSEENMEVELLAEAPYDDIYPLWLQAQVDFANGEYNRYQNTMQVYNAHYGNFVVWLAEHFERERMPEL